MCKRQRIYGKTTSKKLIFTTRVGEGNNEIALSNKLYNHRVLVEVFKSKSDLAKECLAKLF